MPPAPTLPRPGARDALYVVDLPGWVHRAYHAAEKATAGGGDVSLKALVIVSAWLVRLLSYREPAFLVAAIEAPPPTWRHLRFEAYKAGRPDRPEAFGRLEQLVADLFAAHEIPTVAAPWCEADDVIATLTACARGAGLQVVIVAVDKDLGQLVGHGVLLWDGKPGGAVHGPDQVIARWGIAPDQIPDFLGLAGDPTDGIPGVDGIGWKGAAKLLIKRGSLDEVIARAAYEDPKLRRRIELGADIARLGRELAGLRCDVPLDLTLAACRVGWESPEPIQNFYRRVASWCPDRGDADYFRELASDVGENQKPYLSADLVARAQAAGWS